MPSTRRSRSSVAKEVVKKKKVSDEGEFESEQHAPVDSSAKQRWELDGNIFETYEDFVAAKRKRNQQKLCEIGLIGAVEGIREEVEAKKASQRGIRKRKSEQASALTRRKSSRLAGEKADGLYVDNESSGKFVIAGQGQAVNSSNNGEEEVEAEPAHFKGRITDESDISVSQAVELCEPKWIDEGSVDRALKFVRERLSTPAKRVVKSPTSVAHVADISAKVEQLSVDDPNLVAKVTPDRIYSVACHPSPDNSIVCAGDKLGYVGMWNVDNRSDETSDGVSLFRVHSRPVSCLSWTPTGNAMLSASYDGSVRLFDPTTQKFSQIFATYDESVAYRNELGRGLDSGYNDWVQYVTPDPRSASEKCFFLSTSKGQAMHVDLRAGKGKLTFNEELSERKINTLSLHPNGHTLASAGLDCTVRLWDIRKLSDSRQAKHKTPKALATQAAGKSVNSAFFSPSGSRLLSTTMANYLDVTHDAHLQKNAFKPSRRVRHDNHTGRWLSTFMAQWHPQQDIFVVGSMQRPRAVEVFDGDGNLLRAIQGEALTAVASRCCFHPSTEKLVVVGGNSSGRVTVAR